MRWLALFLVFASIPANAEVVKFEIISRQDSAIEGREFGQAGLVEKITGRAIVALDPQDPRNAVIVDLSLAPRNAEGRVETVTDVVILRPQRQNGTLLFEVLNRGRKLMPGWTQDTDTNASIRLEQASDAGNGFLLESGYTLVWAAWQADAPGTMRIDLPIVSGVTGLSREEFTLPPGPGPHRVPLSYPVADSSSIQLVVHGRADEPRQQMGALTLLDPKMLEVTPAQGAVAGALYEVSYTATDSRVTGIGLAAIRDVTAFLRRDRSSMNPLAADGRTGIDRAIGFGISQSGRVLRDSLYFGMNEDERGRLVFEGAMPIIPGARRSFTNDRFAQPSRNPGPEFDRLYPVLQFPFTYPVLDDPLSGRRDGILQRCRLSDTCPRIMQMDSEFEFWGSQASLLVTDPQGMPIDMPSDVRLYLLTGAPHASPWNAVAAKNAACELPINPHSSGAALRALITNMQAWISDGIQPPASRYPQIGQGTLVPPNRAYPKIPALGYRGQYVRANLIEQTELVPVIKSEYPIFVPLAGSDGNAIAGIRMPIVGAPRASYTGWNPHVGTHDQQDLCTQLGGVLPLPATAAEARAAGDPRPALEDLYRHQRLMLMPCVRSQKNSFTAA